MRSPKWWNTTTFKVRFHWQRLEVVASITQKMIYQWTLPETDIAPENRPGPKRNFIFQPLISRGNSFLQGGYSPRNPVRKWISDFCFLEDFLPEKNTKQPQKTSQQISKKNRRLQSELPPKKNKKGAVRPKFKIDTLPRKRTNDNGKFQPVKDVSPMQKMGNMPIAMLVPT